MKFRTKRNLRNEIRQLSDLADMYQCDYHHAMGRIDNLKQIVDIKEGEILELKCTKSGLERRSDSQDNAIRSMARTIEGLTEKNIRQTEELGGLRDQYAQLQKEYRNLEQKFRIIDDAIGRVTKQRDAAKAELQKVKGQTDIWKSDVEYYSTTTNFLSTLLAHVINGYSNGKRILIKAKEFDEVVAKVEEITGYKMSEIVELYESMNKDNALKEEGTDDAT